MKNRCTDPSEETIEEREARIDAMLREMVVEAGLFAMENKEDPPSFTRDQIGIFCGCCKDSVRRIEEQALDKVRRKLSK